MDFSKVRFYNFFGNGDLFSTREFVKELILEHPNIKFEYSHGKPERMFYDIENLEYSKIDNYCDNSKEKYIINNTLYINTWVGYKGKHITAENTVCITNVRKLFNDRFEGFHSFNKNINNYVPNLDFKKFEINNIDKFLKNRRTAPLIFISNCLAHSGQAENFDFDPIIEKLCDEFPYFDFISTNETLVNKTNLFYSKDITKSKDGFDLNELSYLSLYCNPIIGRGSGAYCFAMNYENCFNLDPKKYFIGFTHTLAGSDLLYGQEKSCIVLSSRETDKNIVGDYISRVLKG